jgi:hypothetical protein
VSIQIVLQQKCYDSLIKCANGTTFTRDECTTKLKDCLEDYGKVCSQLFLLRLVADTYMGTISPTKFFNVTDKILLYMLHHACNEVS